MKLTPRRRPRHVPPATEAMRDERLRLVIKRMERPSRRLGPRDEKRLREIEARMNAHEMWRMWPAFRRMEREIERKERLAARMRKLVDQANGGEGKS